ncbi:uncharacterized protein [Amphiura filiformis]|uniref:uncharacterized protein n=1 Tax=Amphiura filiformis TaxID=82378 RepID=UPI003B212381
MSSRKRKLHSEDPGSDASLSKKKKTKHRKRPRSLFEKPNNSDVNDSDFEDEADNDPDWIAEKQSNCLSSEDEGDTAIDKCDASTKGAKKGKRRKGKRSLTQKKGKKKESSEEVQTVVCTKRNEGGKSRGKIALFVCHICQKEVRSLSVHLRTNHRVYPTTNCDQCMRPQTKMSNHRRGHVEDEKGQTVNGPLKCLNCMKCYDDMSKFDIHTRYYCPLNDMGEKKGNSGDSTEQDEASQAAAQERKAHFVCHICQKEVKSLSTHLRTNHRVYPTTNCDQCMRPQTKMNTHRRGHAEDERGQTVNGPLKCLNCMKCYDDISKFDIHTRFYCPLNDKGEKKGNSGDITEQGEASLGAVQESRSDKVFKCDSCEAKFESFSDFQAHSASHVLTRQTKTQRSVRCPKCSLVFRSFQYLQVHNTKVHSDKELQVYKCNVCQKEYNHKRGLQNHKSNYHRERTFRCQFCDLVFPSRAKTICHERNSHDISTKAKSVCEYCGKVVMSKLKHQHIRKYCPMNPNRREKQKKQQSAKDDMPSGSNVTSRRNFAQLTSSKSQHLGSSMWVTSRIPESECYECKKCCILFESQDNYVIHKQNCQVVAKNESDNNHTGNVNENQKEREVYACEACPEIFSKMLRLLEHKASQHSIANESQKEREFYKKMYTCEACPEIFSGMFRLLEHEASEHSKFLVCTDCNETVPDEETLEMHVMLECPERYRLFSTKKTPRWGPMVTEASNERIEINQDSFGNHDTSGNPDDRLFSNKKTPIDVAMVTEANNERIEINQDSSGNHDTSGNPDDKIFSNKKTPGSVAMVTEESNERIEINQDSSGNHDTSGNPDEKIFSNKKTPGSIAMVTEANNEIIEINQVSPGNPVKSLSRSCIDVSDDESVSKQMNALLGEDKQNLSGIEEEMSVNNAENDKQHASGLSEEMPVNNNTNEISYDKKKNRNHPVATCKICNRGLASQHLKRHENAHALDQQRQSINGQFACPHCSKRYEKKRNLNLHKQLFCYHDQPDSKVDGCELDPAVGLEKLPACTICFARFDNKELLSLHKMIHVVHVVADQSLMGSTCTTSTSDEKDIEIDCGYVNIAGAKKEIICDLCNVEFSSTEALKEHQKRVALTRPKYPHLCPCCYKTRVVIKSECHFLQHKKQFKVLCEFCGQHFKDIRALPKHIKHGHDYDYQNKKKCPGCHRIFSHQNYMQHVEYNKKEVERLNCKCLSCGEVFDSVKTLDKHATNEFKNNCNICCQHNFPQFSDLEKHVEEFHNVSAKGRSKKLQNLCKHCDKVFDKASLLSAHVKSVLEEESSESLLCSWEFKYSTCLHCGMVFTNHSDYKLHKYIWRYDCNICHKHFQIATGQRGHQHAHQRDSVTECKYCGHKFNTFTERRYHEHNVNRGKLIPYEFPLPCQDCGETLSTICQLYIHKTKTRHTPYMHQYIVSCRFCRLQFDFEQKCGIGSFRDHIRAVNEECICGAKLVNTCQRKIHNIKHREERHEKWVEKKKKRKREREKMAVENKKEKEGEQIGYMNNTVMEIVDEERKRERKQMVREIHKYRKIFKNKGMKKAEQVVSKRKPVGKRYECVHCGAVFKSRSRVRYHKKKKAIRCNVCNIDIPHCQIAKHRVHRIQAKTCGYCLKDISPGYRLHDHRKFLDKVYLCSCGEKVRSTCQKELHEASDRFVCYKCGRHFKTYEDLIKHLIRYNNLNVVSTTDDTAANSKTGLSKEMSSIEMTTWDTIQKEGKTLYVCLLCGEEVATPQEKNEHKSSFKYECPQCKKHFKTQLEATHHFTLVEHDIASSSNGKQKRTKQTTDHAGNAKKKKKGKVHDILMVYGEQSVCYEVDQQYIECEQQLERSTKEIQIGYDVYSILTNNTTDHTVIGLDNLRNSGEAENKCQVSSISETLQRTDGPPATTPSEAPSVKPHQKQETATKGPGYNGTRKQYICIQCKQVFILAGLYKQHEKIHNTNGVLYTCTKCARMFDTLCGLEYHIARMCKHCGKHFSEVEAKTDHEQQCRIETNTMNNKISSDVRMADYSEDSRSRLVTSRKGIRNTSCGNGRSYGESGRNGRDSGRTGGER